MSNNGEPEFELVSDGIQEVEVEEEQFDVSTEDLSGGFTLQSAAFTVGGSWYPAVVMEVLPLFADTEVPTARHTFVMPVEMMLGLDQMWRKVIREAIQKSVQEEQKRL